MVDARRDEGGRVTCPNCRKRYIPELGVRKTNAPIQTEFPKATPAQREQMITGLCSDKCWNQFLGVPSRDDSSGDCRVIKHFVRRK